MLTRIDFCSQVKAEQINPLPHMAVISLTTPGKPDAALQPGWAAVLRLAFHDVDSDQGGYVLFSRNHADAILDFVDSLPAGTTHLIVHCHAGISRSAGVVRFLAGRHQVSFPPNYAIYNRLVYSTLAAEQARRDYA